MPLIDPFGRSITYLRLSITDRCDFRCTYCMAEEMEFLPRGAILSLEECLCLARVFVSLGVTKIRVTGGEPLARRNAVWLIGEIAALPGLHELVLTTNGSQLARHAHALRAAGVRRLNVSLDTLNAGRFKAITRTGDLGDVLRGIEAAKDAGFENIKLNVVMMRGVNDGEFPELVRFALERGLDITFIEEMPVGKTDCARSDYRTDEALAQLQRRFALVPGDESTGGPARYWRIPGSATRIGFISPHSHNFCASCNRVRVSCSGELFPCLGQNEAVQLLPVLRAHPADDAPLRKAILAGVRSKPEGHDFDLRAPLPKVVRFMSVTGG